MVRKQNGSKIKANDKQNKSKSVTNVNVNKNVNENVNANVNVSDSCVDGLQEIIDFYNNNVGMLTPYRIRNIDRLCKRNVERFNNFSYEKSRRG